MSANTACSSISSPACDMAGSVRCPLAPVRALTAQNWTATPRSGSIWLAGGGVTENRMPKSLNVKSSV